MTNKEIEGRTEKEVIELLKGAGLGKIIRHKMIDYSDAKRIIFEGKFIDSDIYDKQIGWICKYLKV